jgi:hypothetical protein
MITTGAVHRLRAGLSYTDLRELLLSLAWAHGLIAGCAASHPGLSPEQHDALVEASRDAWRRGAAEALALSPYDQAQAAARMVAAHARTEP